MSAEQTNNYWLSATNPIIVNGFYTCKIKAVEFSDVILVHTSITDRDLVSEISEFHILFQFGRNYTWFWRKK